MRLLYTYALLLFTLIPALGQNYKSLNTKLLGRWHDENLPKNAFGVSYSSCWGYTQDGREYAIVGCANGAAFIDVTDPVNPTFIDFVKGEIESAIWREFKTYQHYTYMVSDDWGENFKIIDMSYLPDSVHVVYSGRNLFSRAHTIFIDGDKLYIGLHDGESMSVFDIGQNPLQPKLLRRLNQDGVQSGAHDMFVRNDTVYASMGFDDGLQIVKFTGTKFEQIGAFDDYPFDGYNHSSYLTPDGKTLIMLDEVPTALPGKSVDVSDPSNPILLDTFHTYTGTATLHNPFPGYNNKVVIACYEDGINIYDYSNPNDIKLVGYFDTHYQTNPGNGDYNGAWSAYTLLPSKNIIVVDMENGLYMIDASEAYAQTPLTIKNADKNLIDLTVNPNPAIEYIKVQIPEAMGTEFNVSAYDLSGKKVFTQNYANINVAREIRIETGRWQPANYMISVSNGKLIGAAQITVTK